ncbi:MAG: hypothetical protein SNH13_02335 [Rikenellaceae bacterium]
MRLPILTTTLATLLCAVGVAAVPEKQPAKLNTSYFKMLQSRTLTSTSDIKWVNFGPAMSGYCDEFWVHPTDPKTLFVNLDMGNCYSTHNGGESWTTVHDWDLTGEQHRIGWIDFSHQDPNFALAIDDKGLLMQSTNRGARFEYITNPKGYPQRSGRGKKSVVAVDPTNDNNWYIGAGQAWRVKNIHRSVKNPTGTKYRNTDYGYFLISKDKGQSWKEVSVGFEDLDVLRIFVNPATPQEVYAFTNNGFYKSRNGGEKWAKCGKGLPYNSPRDGSMHYDKASGRVTLYMVEQTHYTQKGESVESSGGVYRSDDGGENWMSITGDLAIDMSVVGKNYFVNSLYYRTIAYWLGVSPAEAKKRYPELPKSTLSVFNRVMVNPTNPQEIFVSNNIKHDFSFSPVEMWMTKDGGKHWYAVLRSGKYWDDQTDKDYWLARGEGKDPLGMNVQYAHLHHEMKDLGSFVGTRFATYAPTGELYVVHEQQTLRSTDAGESWQQIDDIETTTDNWVGRGCSNLPGAGFELELGKKRNFLFRSGEHGLWERGDMGDCKYNGVAVKQIAGQCHGTGQETSISAVAVHPQDTMKIYILLFRQGYRGELRATDNGGKSWYTVNKNVVAFTPKVHNEMCEQNDLRIDPTNPKRMYFTLPTLRYSAHTQSQWQNNRLKLVEEYGVFRTDDGGVNWTPVNKGLPKGMSVLRLEMDPKNPKTLYASVTGDFVDPQKPAKVEGGALYRSTNGGDSWKRVRIPAEIECVNHLYVDRNTGELYLSAGQGNGTVEAGGVWSSVNNGSSWNKIFEMPFVKSCFTSKQNPNIITVNVGDCRKIGRINAGAYLSTDGANNWRKINYNLGQPGRITELCPDPHDERYIWSGLYGSGWYRAEIKTQ